MSEPVKDEPVKDEPVKDETPVDDEVKSRRSKIILGGAVAGVVGFIITFVTLFVVNQNGGTEQASEVVGTVEGKLFTLNDASGLAANAEADLMIGVPTQYEVSDSLSTQTSSSNVYKIVSGDVESGFAQLASVLGVEGSFYSKKYEYENTATSYEVWWGFEENGFVDYERPNITAYYTEGSDGALSWNYSRGYTDVFNEPVESPDFGENDMVLEIDENGNVVNADEVGISPEELAEVEAEIAEEGTAPVEEGGTGGEGAGEANIEAVTATTVNMLTELGVGETDYELYVDSRWGVNVIAEILVEGEKTPISYSFFYTLEGELENAYGMLYEIENMGTYDVISAYDAAARANNYMWHGQAPQSEYTAYYEVLESPEVLNEIELREETISDTIENGVSYITETGGIAELRPESFEQTEAKGLIVEYVEGENPDSPDGGINGFETIEEAGSFTVERNLGGNMWLVLFPEPKTVEATEELISELLAVDVFELVAGDYVIGEIPVEPVEPPSIMLDNAKPVWTTITDGEGSVFLVKGYLLTSSESEFTLISVIGIPEEVVDIQTPEVVAFDEPLDSGAGGGAGGDMMVEEPDFVEGFNPDEEAEVDSELVEELAE